MRNLIGSFALAALTASSFAFAQGQGQANKHIKKAADALDDAAKQVRRANPQCRNAVSDQLERISRQVDDLKRDGRAASAARLKFDVSNLSSTASWNNCPDPVLNNLERAEDFLDDARSAMFDNNRPNDRRDRRDDDDDDRWLQATLNPLQVQVNSNFEGEAAVKVTVPELTLRNLRGQRFYLGARYRSLQGHWSEWVTTSQWSVPSDPFVWKNAFTHFFRYSTLAEDDFSNGRFVARISVFDTRGRELAFREVSFTVPRLPKLPPAVPVVVQPPVQQRDCGTGPDVGCQMMRDGRWAMDGATFNGFLRSMQANSSELMRSQTARTMFGNNYVTAVQFGMVLDLFQSELNKMQVAQAGAPRVVNPQHAIGYADKFASNLNRTNYTNLMAAQLNGQPGPGQVVVVQQPPPPPPPPGNRPPPPPPPPPGPMANRDCGTGPQDPGCSMPRNGMWAMDAMTWAGFYNSVRSTPNELTRQSNVQAVLGRQAITAAQLGLLLDLFNNELTRLDVAKFAAPRTVNPMHAIGLSTKFRNSILANDYIAVMSRQ